MIHTHTHTYIYIYIYILSFSMLKKTLLEFMLIIALMFNIFQLIKIQNGISLLFSFMNFNFYIQFIL